MPSARARDRYLPGVLLACAVFAVYYRVLGYGFLDWDDSRNLVFNPNFRGLGLEQLRWMFGQLSGVHYYPLTWLSFALDYLVWGMDPAGYHLTNVILHALNAWLFYRLCLLLLGGTGELRQARLQGAALFAALFFALHPLRVESVAWVTERSDVLSGAFYLGTLILYLEGSVAGAAFAFCLALLSKATGVMLPLVLVVLDSYRGEPSSRKSLIEKIPFFALALAAGALGLFAHQQGTTVSLERLGFSLRLAYAAFGLAFYLRKTLLPFGLIHLYVAPVPLEPFSPSFILSAMGVLAVTAVLIAIRRRWPAGLAAWLCYAVVLVPALGLFKFGPQLAADRYSYLSCLPFAVLAGGALGKGLAWRARPACLASAALISCLLGLASWRQTSYWRDTETLWRHALDVCPDHYAAHDYLGNILEGQGKLGEAALHYRQALIYNPDLGSAHNDLATVLSREGKLDEAIRHYRQALRLSPGHWAVHHNLGVALARQGRAKEAAAELRQELAINPGAAQSRQLLERILARESHAR